MRPGGSRRTSSAARTSYAELQGRTINQARRRIVELLAQSGDLVGEPQPVTRAVKFFEKGERPVEIVTSRQWFIRTIEHREELIARGRELAWHPPYMRARFEDWVNGLTGDWCISRQRFFGVPFPVWYPIDDSGTVRYEQPIAASRVAAPSRSLDRRARRLRSRSARSAGRIRGRSRRDGHVGNLVADAADRWACGRGRGAVQKGVSDGRAPAGARHHQDVAVLDVLRSQLDEDVLPWRNAAISGWVLDPDRKKMSKSKGNVVTPMHLLQEYGADAARYWAASGRPGTDTAFDAQQMKVGRRLAVKLLNASKFALADLPPAGQALTHPLDRALIARLADVVQDATDSFEEYDYARALERAESFFWWYCDFYLELVKSRRYDADQRVSASVSLALRTSLSVFHRLFAPFLPFVCEEVWSWWQGGSVHRARWPDAEELAEAARGDEARRGVEADVGAREDVALEVTVDVLREVRKAKSQARRPMRAPVSRVVVRDTVERLAALALGEDDLVQAGSIERVETVEDGEFAVEVELAEE